MNSDFSDFIRFFPIFRLFPTSRLLDSTALVWTLARMVWGTYAVKIEVQMAFDKFAQIDLEIKSPRVLVSAISIWAMPK